MTCRFSSDAAGHFSLWSGFGDKTFSAFWAGHFDSAFSFWQTQTLFTVLTANIAVRTVLYAEDPLGNAFLNRIPPAQENAIFLLTLIDLLGKHTPNHPNTADIG